ncbi:hypothetical protein [Enterococcus sp. AZ091]|uniref:hypothetical protein n=1 Tax=Enterococcus sp. AZ091 TaxID=2774720 RepID=UPI003F68C96A
MKNKDEKVREMRRLEDEKKKNREKIELLCYLCQNRPNLFIFELSELVEAPIEKTFLWIKGYHLPYHWKYKY